MWCNNTPKHSPFSPNNILFTINHTQWSLWMTNSLSPWTVPHKTSYNSSHMLSCSPPISSMFPLHIMKQQWKLDKYFIGNKSDILLPGFETWKLGDLWQLNSQSTEEETLTYHKQSFVHKKPKNITSPTPCCENIPTSKFLAVFAASMHVLLWGGDMYYFLNISWIIGITYFVIFGSSWAQCLDI